MSGTRTTVYSLDFDGCADILFKDLFDKYKGDKASCMALSVLRDKFSRFLDEKAKESKSEVELYVGSNRQSRTLDSVSHLRENNGLCLDLFPKLANERGWKFIPVLYADKQSDIDFGAGAAYKDHKLTCVIDVPKINTIMHQLRHIEKQHTNPKDEVHFYFCDDDHRNEILRGLNTHLKSVKAEIPENIHIHLIKFDWYGEIMENQETLKEFAVITGTKKIQSNLAVTSSSLSMFNTQAQTGIAATVFGGVMTMLKR